MTQPSKLREILDQVYFWNKYPEGQGLLPEQAESAIKELMRKCVPKKQEYISDPLGGPDDAEDVASVYGFNIACQAMLEEIERI